MRKKKRKKQRKHTALLQSIIEVLEKAVPETQGFEIVCFLSSTFPWKKR